MSKKRPKTLAAAGKKKFSSRGKTNRNGALKNVSKSIIHELSGDEIRAKSCWSIGPDNVVIKCNWLLIGHNALHLHSFNYVWLSCPSIDGCRHCKPSSSMQLSVALMIFDCGGNEWLRFEWFPSVCEWCLPRHIRVAAGCLGVWAKDVQGEDSKYQIW